ncbi:phosphoribosyltransferase [Pilimelia columellifera]|uniref:Phosphoribosyltransferase family protein n=1 Tax=Pilimelia columellifera subsp. columellifera TaxID=706583 RepID=A0ABP6AYR6_9ACTN
MELFEDRVDAGNQLAGELLARHVSADLVLGLPRGGVPVAARVAAALGADLDIAVIRKIGAPGRPELGVGAMAEDEHPCFDQSNLSWLGLRPSDLAETAAAEVVELRRRVALYRGSRPRLPLDGRRVLVVDDGLATGVTARAALRWARRKEPAWLGFAAPVSAPDGATLLASYADRVFLLRRPPSFAAVGAWYRDFSATTDAEVIDLLRVAVRH